MNENIGIIAEKSELKKVKEKISKLYSANFDFIYLSKMDEEEVANCLAERCSRAGWFKAVLLLAVTGPGPLRSLKKIFSIPFLSFDNAVISTVGRNPLAKIISVVSTRLEEETLRTYKALYEFTPNQLAVLTLDDLNELPDLCGQGYRMLVPCAVELLENPSLLSGRIEGLNMTVEDPLSLLIEEAALLCRGKVKPSTIEVKKVLPCVADPSKVRFIAQVDVNVESLLPVLYLHLKRSNYIEALDVLTFTTDREELVSIYGSGKICAGKVKPERVEGLLSDLLNLLVKAFNYLSLHGPPPESLLEVRRKLNPNMVYQHLPKLNCGKCGEKTCLAFAVKLFLGECELENCTPLGEEKYREDREFLQKLLKPIL